MNRTGLLLFLLLLGPGAAQALSPGDGIIIHFKSGSSLSGVLVEQTPARIIIDVGGARMTSDMFQVQRVEPGKTDVWRFQEMLAAAGNDPRKLRDVAAFARAHDLHTYYDRLAKQLDLPQDAGSPPPPALVRDAAPSPPPPQPAPLGSESQPLPPLGFAGQSPQVPPAGSPFDDPTDVDSDIGASPVGPRRLTREDRDGFMKQQASEREARKHAVTDPTSDFQFSLQQALDRQAHGLPFNSPTPAN